MAGLATHPEAMTLESTLPKSYSPTSRSLYLLQLLRLFWLFCTAD